MSELSRFYGLVIGMFFNEHGIPHFHVRYGEHQVSIAIEDLQILEGGLPPRQLGMVMEWAALHQNELLKDWELTSSLKNPDKIEPLKR